MENRCRQKIGINFKEFLFYGYFPKDSIIVESHSPLSNSAAFLVTVQTVIVMEPHCKYLTEKLVGAGHSHLNEDVGKVQHTVT